MGLLGFLVQEKVEAGEVIFHDFCVFPGPPGKLGDQSESAGGFIYKTEASGSCAAQGVGMTLAWLKRPARPGAGS